MNMSELCTITDRQALSDIIEALIVKCGNENERAAAEFIGISQPTLNRLRRHGVNQITRATALALARAVKTLADADPVFREMITDLRNALISPATQQYVHGYLAWCDERATRWQENTGAMWKVGPLLQLDVSISPAATLAPLRQELVRMLWQRVHAEFPDIMRKFRDEMVRRDVNERRQEVAVIRVIEPLLEATGAAYIERSYSELTERERRDFIDAGIKRELILLDREPALTRARRIAEEGADTFAKQQGERALYARDRQPDIQTNGMKS